MDSIATLFDKYNLFEKTKHKPSERDLIIGELYKGMIEDDLKNPYYIDKNGKKKKRKIWTIQYFATFMAPHSIDQLYFLKSICGDYQKRGGNYGKCLLGAIKTK